VLLLNVTVIVSSVKATTIPIFITRLATLCLWKDFQI
jgi:hypothetical protein